MSWVGSCNQCGLCCTKMHGKVAYRCEHLELLTHTQTRCVIYDDRVPGMAVQMISPHGSTRRSRCDFPQYPRGLPDDFPLAANCSYRWVEDPQPQP